MAAPSPRHIICNMNNKLNSHARTGERPLYRVCPLPFAVANLSPFQSGYGSLQCFSVYQNVPRIEQDYQLSGLRQDEVTARAPGVFRETPTLGNDESSNPADDSWVGGQRLPAAPPDMVRPKNNTRAD